MLNSEDRINDTHIVMRYFNACNPHGMSTPLKLTTESDIWSFVYPFEATVSILDEGAMISISCGCEWEIEHGLELIFENGNKLIRADGH